MWCGRDKCTSQASEIRTQSLPQTCQSRKNADFCSFCFPFFMGLQHWITWAHLGWHRLHIHMAHSLRLCVVKEKGHIAQASTKLPLRGLLFLYFSFLFNQEKNSEREGKAAPLSSVKALCMQRAALQVFITSLGWCARVFPRQPEGPWRGRRELWRHLTAGRDCSWGRRVLGQDRSYTGFSGLPSSDISWLFKAQLQVQCWQHRERKRGGKQNSTREILTRQAARMRQTWKLLPSFRILRQTVLYSLI